MAEESLPNGPFPFSWTELSDEENRRIKATVNQSPFNDLIRYPGNVVLPRNFLPIADRLYNFSVKEDDIWIVTYPKCGTTWTQEMVWQIVNGVDKEKGKMPLFARSPFLEMGCLLPTPEEVLQDGQTDWVEKVAEGGPEGEDMDEGTKAMIAHMEDPIEYANALSGRRVMKCHLPMDFLPPGVLDKCKIVYVARNPKDCAVSYFYHSQLFHGYVGDFEEFIKQFEEDITLYGSYWHHILSGWDLKDHKNFSFIWFEEMKKNQKGVIKNLCQFLDQPLSEDKIDELVESLKFENVKKNPAVNNEQFQQDDKKGKFMRKGIVGDWKNHFDEEANQNWNNWIEKNIQGKNLVIPGK